MFYIYFILEEFVSIFTRWSGGDCVDGENGDYKDGNNIGVCDDGCCDDGNDNSNGIGQSDYGDCDGIRDVYANDNVVIILAMVMILVSQIMVIVILLGMSMVIM